jgi:hypothetical protein
MTQISAFQEQIKHNDSIALGTNLLQGIYSKVALVERVQTHTVKCTVKKLCSFSTISRTE